MIRPRRSRATARGQPSTHRLFNSLRQIIETVYSQLADPINIETNYAHTSRDLYLRYYSKLTVQTLSIYTNRLKGVHDYLQIKKLAFPNLRSPRQLSGAFSCPACHLKEKQIMTGKAVAISAYFENRLIDLLFVSIFP